MTHAESTYQTKKALGNALKELAKHKELSKITVSELITTCNVNRKTFYYHFDDIYDLVKWIIEQETLDKIQNYNLINDYSGTIEFLLNYIESNSHFLISVYYTVGHDIVKNLFKQDLTQIVTQLIDDTEAELNSRIPADFKLFLCDLYIDSTISMLINSIKNPYKYDNDKIVDYFKLTLPSIIPTAIKNYNDSSYTV